MKYIIIFILTFLSSLSLYSRQWRVIEKENTFYIQNIKDNSLKYEVISVGGRPRFEGEVIKDEIAPNVLLKYFAGSAGTKYLIYQHWAVVFNTETKEFLGNFPYEYKTFSRDVSVENPIWKFSKDKIHIIDKETFLNKKIKLKTK